jgi:hypothetical protein
VATGEDYCDLFTEDAVDVKHFLCTSHGRQEIKEWFIPAMSTWTEMSYPLQRRTFDQQEGLLSLRWQQHARR